MQIVGATPIIRALLLLIGISPRHFVKKAASSAASLAARPGAPPRRLIGHCLHGDHFTAPPSSPSAATASVALGGDGQVTLGNVVVKATARKVRRLYHDRVLAGFAGATADAFTLFERFEAKLDKHQGHLTRAAVELAKDWRSDRILRRLEAMLAVADRTASLIITGNGDVLEPEHGIVAIGSGGAVRAGGGAGAARAHRAAAAGDRQAGADHRRRPLHLHQPAPRDRGAGAGEGLAPWIRQRCDVVIAGAGLVGLALAPALARVGAVASRSPTARRSPRPSPPTPADWDARVYAISPGSAAFLRAIGAWQALPPERIDAGRGDAGRPATPAPMLDVLGLRPRRARAGVDRRGARAARRAGAAASRGRRRGASAARTFVGFAWSRRRGDADRRDDGG